MLSQDADFFKELLSMFKMETDEHIEAIHKGLDSMNEGMSPNEKNEILAVVHRSAHSLKGAARTVGLLEVETAGKHLERLFLLLKNGQMELTADLTQLFHDSVDKLGALIETLDETGEVTGSAVEVIHRLETIEKKINA